MLMTGKLPSAMNLRNTFIRLLAFQPILAKYRELIRDAGHGDPDMV
jgi:hypothetical protein